MKPHFRLDECTEPLTGQQTSMGRTCMGCRTPLTGCGGGGSYICIPCWQVLHRGILKHELRKNHERTNECDHDWQVDMNATWCKKCKATRLNDAS